MFSLVWGSGLKFQTLCPLNPSALCSPSYEGVDWNKLDIQAVIAASRSPSYEGVDWNINVIRVYTTAARSPSYEGVDWNLACYRINVATAACSPSYEGVDWNILEKLNTKLHMEVLPRMREWIEIPSEHSAMQLSSFSLVWGSGLKYSNWGQVEQWGRFSLVWGSGLK